MTEIPQEMWAIDPQSPGGPEVLVPHKCAVPMPGNDEVLIQVMAAGVNRPDVAQRAGSYPPPAGASTILGLEVAGKIVALGSNVDRTYLGQEVCALVAGGGYANYVAAPVGQCLPRPSILSWEAAAALPETLFTVWVNLFERAYAKPGETVLIHGGTSGIGTTAIQLARSFGLTSIVTCGTDHKCAAALNIGAHHAINYQNTDFVERVKALTNGRGVDIVLDMVGGDYLERNMRCLAVDGRLSLIAIQRGAQAQMNLWPLLAKRLTLTGSTLRSRSVEFKSLIADELSAHVWPLIEAGEFRPVMDQVFPLEQAADAHRHMEAGDHIGKITLRLHQP